jgi:hypothetical protein
MTDYADIVILLLLMGGFCALVGAIHALITIVGWILSHYKRTRGIQRW